MAVWDVEDPLGNVSQEHGDFDCGNLLLHARRCIKVDSNLRAEWGAKTVDMADDVKAGLGEAHPG